MGRRVHEQNTGEFVWKYVLAEQPSEQYRIVEELGIGELDTLKIEDEDNTIPTGDVVIIEDIEEAIEKMEEYLENCDAYAKIKSYEKLLDKVYEEEEDSVAYKMPREEREQRKEHWKKENDEDINFYRMLTSYIDFMERYKDEHDEFIFIGEF